MIELKVDGRKVQVEKGASILDAARTANIKIPTLCYHEDQAIKSICRLCVVEVKGRPGLQAACSTPAENGMVVHTVSPKIIRVRKQVMELILSRHPAKCLTCAKNGFCELQDVAHSLNMLKDADYEEVKRR